MDLTAVTKWKTSDIRKRAYHGGLLKMAAAEGRRSELEEVNYGRPCLRTRPNCYIGDVTAEVVPMRIAPLR